MKPENLSTKIFLDSGDPDETQEIMSLLGFLDGQTTNPTLISKNPHAKEQFESGKKFSNQEILDFYKKVVTDVSHMIPNGSVSIEVYADKDTTSDFMLDQGRKMFTWIPNAHIKYPTTMAGLTAAEQSIAEHIRVNMTLVFTQAQAAAVYAATRGARRGEVFVSPFIGRLDDLNQDGMSLIENIMNMYSDGDGHVEVLAASIRNYDHFLQSLKLGAHIITAPFKILKEWADKGMPIPGNDYQYESGNLEAIPFEQLDMSGAWKYFDISHKLTSSGIERFANDWNDLIG